MSESAGESRAGGVVELEDRAREALGAAPEETLRLLQVSDRWIVLGRDPDGASVAVRGLLALQADVAVLGLPDLLGAIHAARRSGYLIFRYRSHEKAVYLHEGEVVFATSNQRVDRLGECLLRAGVITLEQLREAERCFRPPGRFGKVLVERGFLTPRELWTGVKYQIEEIVRSLFAYPGGTVCFWHGETRPDNVVRLSLETRRLVAEGVQRREELRKFLTVLEDPRVRLVGAQGFQGQLAGSERTLAEAIGDGGSFDEVRRALDLDREAAARSIQLLRLVGAVKITRHSPPDELSEADLRDADDPDLRERVAALTKLVAELAAVVSRAEGSSDVEERLARVLDDVMGRFPVLLTGLTLGPGATLDPEQLAERALRLPGDREALVVGALGELVAYLEFEVKNHPAIEEPDAVLDGLHELRSALAPS